ncbi:hypothetical protein [Maricaulis sp.]|uniref:hypothetical protein n=1 Tax=Maricaulis sp. TaxID=1486257 RepID=UPI001B195BE2|nr:hypothetical protein [Maricaulis sp.]MBO6766073.1 hypothetical protein [Maricaulis sp.]
MANLFRVSLAFSSIALSACNYGSHSEGAFFENNGRPEVISNGCFLAVSQPMEEWRVNGEIGNLYINEIVPESYKRGRPQFPPIMKNNIVYIYVSCSEEYVLPESWVAEEISEEQYRRYLVEFDGGEGAGHR